ncbi:hypothetical protein ADS79_28025 [Brevibacillus reuszeri]|uniref:Uncharacterized protein n=1 Tax=Brevibacillus reuszeri TaxID=54915 RepID=A0A0K9YNF9_9BACL|nr:hypothetical protein ADS79_28025 [Brevibacillus reuszeri]
MIALWDADQGGEEKTKHVFKLRDPLKQSLWARFCFFLGAGLGHSQLVSREARAFSLLSSPPPKATIKYSLIPSPLVYKFLYVQKQKEHPPLRADAFLLTAMLFVEFVFI